MKKLVLCLVLTVCVLALTPAPASADDLPKIAVYVAGGDNASEKQVLGTLILDALIKSGRYVAIERADDFTEQIDREQIKQRSGAVDENEIRRLGTQAGVQFVCVVNRECAFGSCLISARIIDVETARVVTMGTAARKSLNTMDEIRKASNEIVETMLGQRLPKGAREAAKPKPAAADPKSAATEPELAAADPGPAAEDTEPAADTKLKSVADTRPQSVADPKPEYAASAEPKSAADTKLKSAADTRPQSFADPKPQPAAAAKPKPAAPEPMNAIGLRYGVGNGIQLPELWFRTSLVKGTRLYLGLGWSAGSAPIAVKDENGADLTGFEYRATEFQGAAFWEWRGGSDRVNWYAGPGMVGGQYTYDYYDNSLARPFLYSESALGLQIGAQGGGGLRWHGLTLNADVRPALHYVFYSDETHTGFMFTVGVGLGYSF